METYSTPAEQGGPVVAAVASALRRSWTMDSSAATDQWSPDNPALGQCEVSSFVAWEHLGGDLVLGQVFVADEFVEHHYWNRLIGGDVDFTADQFDATVEVREVSTLTSAEIQAKRHEMRPELVARVETLRAAVDQNLRPRN